MRILHVSASYLPAVRYGGTIVSVHGLCKALAARGHDVHVYTTSVDGDRDSDVPLGEAVDVDGVKVSYFQSRHLRKLYWSPPMGAALNRRAGAFDVVHTQAIYLWPMWAAARAARRASVPYVMSPRGMLEKDLIQRKSPFAKGALIALFEKRNLERAAAIHVTSRREADEAAAFGFNLPPFIEIPNGVTIDPGDGGALSPAIQSIVESGPFVLFLGRISWKKGLDRLLAALVHAPSVRLVVAGNDEEELLPRLRTQASTLGVSHRVAFVGAVEGADKAALLTHAAALALTSYSENFGNVVIEAMAAGTAVLLTPEVGLSHTIAETGAGLVTDADPRRLGTAMERLVSDVTFREQLGARGREVVEARFTWARVAEQMESAYASILAAGTPH